MNEYLLRMTGLEMKVDKALDVLCDLEPQVISKKGETTRTVSGLIVENANLKANWTNSLDFNSNSSTFISFLKYVDSKRKKLEFVKYDSIEFWAFLYRTDQINDELSRDEIQFLAKLGATFCWTVIIENN